MKRTRSILPMLLFAVIFMMLGAPAHAQTFLTTTTTTAAVTSRSQQQVPLTAVTGMNVNDYLWWDGEVSQVQAINTTSKIVTLTRGKRGTTPNDSLGAGRGHASGVTVLYGPVKAFYLDDVSGACTAANEQYMPHVVVTSGRVYDCIGSVWQVVRDIFGTPTETQLVDNASVASGTTQSTDYTLNSIVIPQAEWALSRGISCRTWGQSAANANAKTYKMFFGATAVATDSTGSYNNVSYLASLDVLRTGISTQFGSATITGTPGAPTAGPTTNSSLAEAETAAITVKFTANNTAAAAASATGKGMTCSLY